jgi:CYTH domain-containing protein
MAAMLRGYGGARGISAAQTVILACVLERTPGAGPYARLEREQRWLLSRLPDDVVDPVAIHDRYLTGSTLRLRRMRTGSGPGTVYKLGQKVRATPDSPERVSLTNMYLREHEFDLLGQLEGATLDKTRWQWPTGDHVLSVDQFEGNLDGLVLAEVELREDEARLPALGLAVADVTSEDRFSGVRLAHLSVEEAALLLASVDELVRHGGRR